MKSMMFLALGFMMTGCAADASSEEPSEMETDEVSSTESALIPADCQLSISWTSLGTSYLWGATTKVTCSKRHSSFKVAASLTSSGGNYARTATCGAGYSCSALVSVYNLSGVQSFTVRVTGTVDGQSSSKSSTTSA